MSYTVPANPTLIDLHFCSTTAQKIRASLEKTGVDDSLPLSDANRSRVLARFILPHLEDISSVTDQLRERADEAEAEYLATAQDREFDRHGLITAIAETRQFQEDLHTYLDMTRTSESMPDDEQREYLAEFVYSPMFHGSGYKVIGDDTSLWTHTTSLYCTPIRLASSLYGSAKGHAEKRAKGVHTIEGSKSGGLLLGALLVGGAGYYFFNKRK